MSKTDIEHLKLGTRITKTLYRNLIFRIEDLLTEGSDSIGDLHGIGQAGLSVIRSALKAGGYEWTATGIDVLLSRPAAELMEFYALGTTRAHRLAVARVLRKITRTSWRADPRVIAQELERLTGV